MGRKTCETVVPEAEQPYPIPVNWRWDYIGNLTTVIRGVSFNKADAHKVRLENDVLIMRGGNVKEGYIDTSSDVVFVNVDLVADNQYIRKNDVIIVASTGSKQVIGRAGISERDYSDVAFGAFLMLVRPLSTSNQRFIDLFFQSVDYRNRIRDLATGTNINNIRVEYITKTPIPFPPLPEQQRIVERVESLLTKLDRAREIVTSLAGFNDMNNTTAGTIDMMKKAILARAFRGLLGTNRPEEKL